MTIDLGVLPDPAELEAIAGRIADYARITRARVALLEHALTASVWQGRAAGAFGDRATDVLVGLRTSAVGLDEAADALRAHAASVRHTIGVLAAFEHGLGTTLQGISGVGDVLSGIGAVAHLVGIG